MIENIWIAVQDEQKTGHVAARPKRLIMKDGRGEEQEDCGRPSCSDQKERKRVCTSRAFP